MFETEKTKKKFENYRCNDDKFIKTTPTRKV